MNEENRLWKWDGRDLKFDHKDGRTLYIYDVEDFINIIEPLLKEAHDKMDYLNNWIDPRNDVPDNCIFCKGPNGYDGNGLIHDEDCILVRIRRVLG